MFAARPGCSKVGVCEDGCQEIALTSARIALLHVTNREVTHRDKGKRPSVAGFVCQMRDRDLLTDQPPRCAVISNVR